MFTVREPEDTSIKDAARDELIEEHWQKLKRIGMAVFRGDDETRYIVSSEILHNIVCELNQPEFEYDLYKQPDELLKKIKELHKQALKSEMEQAIQDFYYD